MKRIITIGITLAALTIVAFGAAPLANAVTETAATSARCTVSKPRLAAQSDKVDAANIAHAEAYASLKTQVEALVASATAKNYDKVTALTTAKTALATKITTFTTDSKTYSTALKSAVDAACGENEATYTTALTAARSALTKTRSDATAVETSFNGAVTAGLKDYAVWLGQQATTNQETN